MEGKLWYMGGEFIVIKYSAGTKSQIHIAVAAQLPPIETVILPDLTDLQSFFF